MTTTAASAIMSASTAGTTTISSSLSFNTAVASATRLAGCSFKGRTDSSKRSRKSLPSNVSAPSRSTVLANLGLRIEGRSAQPAAQYATDAHQNAACDIGDADG